jgi:predicted ABC-type ATPase
VRVQQTTPRKPEKPILWIVAGPNGSGKSSLYNRSDIEGWGGSVWIINPDLLTAKILEQEQLEMQEANLAAVKRIEKWLNASVDAYQTVGVETVLSSPKYQKLVIRAKQAGFEIRMIYVVLKSAELQVKRVAIRVAEGGHDVPHHKIKSRRLRSFEQLAWFVKHVDQCFIYDNSDGMPDLLAELADNLANQIGPALWCWKKLPADLEAILKGNGVSIFKRL